MKRTTQVAEASMGVLVVAGVWFLSNAPAKGYEREPTQARLGAQRMLVVEWVGDPAAVAPAAFRELFTLYGRLDGAKKVPPPAPRVRWASVQAPKEEWRGRYAIPVPDTVTRVPAPARLETWTYGEVAQLAYEGAYTTDEQTIETLHAFIDDRGYEIAGDHEEEYLRGPGPSLTLIRYEIRPKAPGQPAHPRSAPWDQLAASWTAQMKLMFR